MGDFTFARAAHYVPIVVRPRIPARKPVSMALPARFCVRAACARVPTQPHIHVRTKERRARDTPITRKGRHKADTVHAPFEFFGAATDR